jgi:hypothetical protein
VTKNKGQTSVELPKTHEDYQLIRARLGIDNLDALKSNFVLFVEGQSEITAFRELGKIAKYSSLKFIPIVSYKSDTHFAKLVEFTRYAHELGLVPLIIADGHRNIQEFDQLGAGWRLYKKIRGENEQFEEQFDSTILVKAMNIICSRYACEFRMSEVELELERVKKDEDGKVSSMAMILEDASPVGLRKTELAKELACIVSSEIESSSPYKLRTPQKFEEEADLIMEWLKL